MRVLFFLLFFFGCATSQPTPELIFPAKLELQLPPEPVYTNMNSLSDYSDMAITKGRCGLPGGILVSDRSYAETIQTYAQRDRLVLERDVLLRLRLTEWIEITKAQDAMVKRLHETDSKLARERRYRPWLLAAGAVLTTSAYLLARRLD